MAESASDTRQPRHDPLGALKQGAFRLYITSRLPGAVAQQMIQAIMAWHVYDITGSALNLGLLGLARLLPALGMSLVGGVIADSYNRRNIVLVAQMLPFSVGLFLCLATVGGWVEIGFIYGGALVLALAQAFESPARTSMLPSLVQTETFENAVVINSTTQSLGFVTGPALGGAVIATAGVGTAYAVFAGAVFLSLIPLAMIRYTQQSGSRRDISLGAIREGLRFVRSRQELLGSMSLDMFAVIFGGATALLPVYAEDILDVGPTGYGILTGSLDLGALLASIVLVMRPPVVRTGRTLIVAVVAFGFATAVFGLSRSFPLSVAAYMCIGMADQVSVVMRNTTVQMVTPDHLRGRVSSVSQVFIQSSNQAGAIESGLVAAATSATFAVVSGGIGAMAVAGIVRVKLRDLWEFRVSSQAVDKATG